jgi:hypothetical protein
MVNTKAPGWEGKGAGSSALSTRLPDCHHWSGEGYNKVKNSNDGGTWLLLEGLRSKFSEGTEGDPWSLSFCEGTKPVLSGTLTANQVQAQVSEEKAKRVEL